MTPLPGHRQRECGRLDDRAGDRRGSGPVGPGHRARSGAARRPCCRAGVQRPRRRSGRLLRRDGVGRREPRRGPGGHRRRPPACRGLRPGPHAGPPRAPRRGRHEAVARDGSRGHGVLGAGRRDQLGDHPRPRRLPLGGGRRPRRGPLPDECGDRRGRARRLARTASRESQLPGRHDVRRDAREGPAVVEPGRRRGRRARRGERDRAARWCPRLRQDRCGQARAGLGRRPAHLRHRRGRELPRPGAP